MSGPTTTACTTSLAIKVRRSSSAPPVPTPWTGRWVADQLGIRVRTTHAPLGVHLDALVGLAVRDNPRRAHLLVSTVLGKHVPTHPGLVYGAGLLLGLLTSDALTGTAAVAAELAEARVGDGLAAALADPAAATGLLSQIEGLASATADAPEGTVVLGYAETATALGHAVADALGAPYLHSTRRPVPGIGEVGGFEEEHSHATSHLLLPADPAFLAGDGALVLVDDELSTGTTALNTIAALHRQAPRCHYVIAALVDLRSGLDRDRMNQVAQSLGVRIEVVALAAGRVDLPADILAAGQALVAAHRGAVSAAPAAIRKATPAAVRRYASWPAAVPVGGRHGFDHKQHVPFTLACAALARDLAAARLGNRVLVLGFEELMYAPLRVAAALSRAGAVIVRYSTTTRSPVLPVDAVGYAIRTALTFPAHDDPAEGPGPRYAYNVAPAAGAPAGWSDIVLVLDAAADTPALTGPDGLLTQLSTLCDQVHLVVLPDPTATAATAATKESK